MYEGFVKRTPWLSECGAGGIWWQSDIAIYSQGKERPFGLPVGEGKNNEYFDHSLFDLPFESHGLPVR